MGSPPVGGSVIRLGGAFSLFTLYPSHQSIYQKDNGSIVSSCCKKCCYLAPGALVRATSRNMGLAHIAEEAAFTEFRMG